MTDDLDGRWVEALRRHSKNAAPTSEAWQAVLRRAHGDATSSRAAVTRRDRRIMAAVAVIGLLAGTAVVVAALRRSDRAATRLSTNTTVPARLGEGRLVVTSDFNGPSDLEGHPLYVEGGVGLTQILQEGKVVAELRGWALGNRTVLNEALPSGTYEVRSWEIACGASGCGVDAKGILNHPSELSAQPVNEACRTEVTIEADAATTVEMRRGLDDTTDPMACSFAIGTPTRVAVAASRLPSGYEGALHRFLITGGPANATLAAGTIDNDLTVLLVDRPIPRGDYKLRIENYDCGPALCPDVGPDGRPDNGAKPLGGLGCDTPFTIGNRPALVVITVETARCTPSRPSVLPRLTVPPAWSLRTPLPTTCGSDKLHAISRTTGNGTDPGKEARQCFARAHNARQPMELVTTEQASPGVSHPIIWRTRAGRLTLIRPPNRTNKAWSEQSCDLGAAPSPEWITARGCGRARPLSLDPP